MRRVDDALARGYTALRSGWVVLGVLGLATIARGAFYLPAVVRESDRLPTVERFAPLGVWALVWISVGSIAVICAVRRRHLGLGVTVITALPAGWGALYIGGWMAGWSQAGYVTALTYLLVSFLTLAYYSRIDLDEQVADPGGGERI